MAKNTLRAGTSPFAHLLANITGRSAARRAEEERDDDHPETGDDTDMEDDADEQSDDSKDKKGRKAKGKRAEDDDDDESEAEDDDDDDASADDDEEEPEEGKRGKRASDEDDDEKEAKGRNAERSRWARVLGHKNAGEGRIAAACNMLATTDMNATAVISTLGTLPTQATRSPGLRERMADTKSPDVGADTGAAGKPSLAAQIVAAGRKRRGEA